MSKRESWCLKRLERDSELYDLINEWGYIFIRETQGFTRRGTEHYYTVWSQGAYFEWMARMAHMLMVSWTKGASAFQPVPAWHRVPLSSQRSDPLPKLPKSLLLSYRLTWIRYGKFWLRFGWYGLVRPCTALYGLPYHTLPNFPKYFISSSLQLLISSYPYTQLISTLPLKLSFVKV